MRRAIIKESDKEYRARFSNHRRTVQETDHHSILMPDPYSDRVGLTAARISQIQTKMEQGRISKQAFAVLSHYKLKP